MANYQTGILAPIPAFARYMTFSLRDAPALPEALDELPALVDGAATVVGLGPSLVAALDRTIAGLRVFPAQTGRGIEIPSTPAALWCWLRGDDPGEIYHRARRLEEALAPALVPDSVLDAFRYGTGLDLSGYEDGTENPKDDAARAAAIVAGAGKGLNGSSFVAVQQWLHDMDVFDAMSKGQQDNTIGRRKDNNKELANAPASAHVKRAAQESFDPQAFMVRRSMPWADAAEAGLQFVAFGKSLDAFEAVLSRMVGHGDGVADALFTFTRPLGGAYFWCPPMANGKLDLSALT